MKTVKSTRDRRVLLPFYSSKSILSLAVHLEGFGSGLSARASVLRVQTARKAVLADSFCMFFNTRERSQSPSFLFM